jgi:hypothetical protein
VRAIHEHVVVRAAISPLVGLKEKKHTPSIFKLSSSLIFKIIFLIIYLI